MTSIANTLGVGSGIDTSSLVSSLVAAQRGPKDTALAARETKNSARISALGGLTSSIDAFASSLNTLISGGTLATQPTSSDESIASISAVAGTRLGDVSAQLEVRQLAQAQTIVATGVPSATQSIGQGTLTLQTATGNVDVTIDSSNDSLAGLAKAINAKSAGISASVLTDATGARLVLKGQTGAANAFTVALSSGDPAGLGRFTYDPQASGGMTLSKGAQDAIVALDGVQTTRATNSITDLIPGAKIDLAKAAVGTVVTIGSTRPTSAIESAVSDFVSAYNELAGQFATATAAAASDGTGGGALRGDRAIADARRQLAALTATPLTASADGPRTLAEIGVSTNRDGTLALDTGQLAAALQAHPDAVEAMFNPSQSVDSPYVTIASKFGAAKPGSYALTNLVAQSGGTPASGTIAGAAATVTGGGAQLAAAYGSGAAGLVVQPSADVASATVTVELGLGGALQAVRDALRGTAGVLTVDGNSLATETSAIATAKADVDTQATAYQTQLTTAFTAMDARIAAYKATQSYLTQQIALWTKSDS